MNNGWALGLLIYGPQLMFFWTLFGGAAIALWLVLAFWLGLFMALLRFVRERRGTTAAALLAPVFWTGIEYFRSELYPLRFTWLNTGYAFTFTTRYQSACATGATGTPSTSSWAELPPRQEISSTTRPS